MNNSVNTNASKPYPTLRQKAGEMAAAYPPLLARAHILASAMDVGAHGRRRAGLGDEFWQYRVAAVGDHPRDIDWRRSAKSDQQYIRQKEWQSAQSVHFWVDEGLSMKFHSQQTLDTKGQRASLLALALAILLERGGERIGVLHDNEPAKPGKAQIEKLASVLLNIPESPQDYSVPPHKLMKRGHRAIYFSDFLGPWDKTVKAMSQVADQGVSGCLVQVLDPSEEIFPFQNRTIFKSVSEKLTFETHKADGLRARYLQRLAERKQALQELARQTGWLFASHRTDASASLVLEWLYTSLEAQA